MAIMDYLPILKHRVFAPIMIRLKWESEIDDMCAKKFLLSACFVNENGMLKIL